MNSIAKYYEELPLGLKAGATIVIVALVFAACYLTFTGRPAPVEPSSRLFSSVTLTGPESLPRTELSSFDFVVRPLFAINRVPDRATGESEQLASQEEQEPKELVVDAKELESLQLLGVYGAEEATGVILRLANGERQRLAIGESVSEWRLTAVQARSAEFSLDTGEVAEVSMVFSNDQTVNSAESTNVAEPTNEAAAQATRETDAKAANGRSSSAEPNAEEPATRSMSFQSVYQNRYPTVNPQEKKSGAREKGKRGAKE